MPRRWATATATATAALGLTLVGAAPAAPAADSPPACPDAATLHRLALPLINAARAQARPCGEQALPAAPALRWNPLLADTALQLAQDLAAFNHLSHQDHEGRPLGVRLQLGGYRYAAAAENIAGGQASVPAVIDAWLASPAHCASLMNDSLREVGLACVARADSSFHTHWVMHLGTPLLPPR